MIKALLLDMDGTMIDSEREIVRIIAEIAHELGHPYDLDFLYTTVGTTYAQTESMIDAQYPHAPNEAIRKECSVRYHAAQRQGLVPMRPGLFALLDAAKAQGLPIAVCTSTRRSSAIEALEGINAMPYLSDMVCGGEAAFGKPEPHPYAMLAARLGICPSCCLAVEDSPSGTRSALSAGMQVVVVPDLVKIPEELVSSVQSVADLFCVIPLLSLANDSSKEKV